MQTTIWSNNWIRYPLLLVLTAGCGGPDPVPLDPPDQELSVMELIKAGVGGVPAGEDPEVVRAFEAKGWRLFNDIALDSHEPLVILNTNGELTVADFELIAKSKVISHLNLASANPTDEGLVALSKLPTLQSLVIFGDRITNQGILALANCQELKSLNLMYLEDLNDETIAAFAALPKLETLIIEQGKLTGECFAKFAGHPKLHTLKLKGMTEFTDQGAGNLAQIPLLKDLELKTKSWSSSSERKLSQAGIRAIVDHRIPLRFQCDPELIDDALFVEMLNKGWLPPSSELEIPKLPADVRVLLLEGYGIGDVGFRAALRFNRASFVSMSNLKLSDDAFAGLQEFSRLDYLKIEQCSVSGQALAEITSLPLEHLAMEKCMLTEDHFRAIGQMNRLEELWLSESEFDGAWFSHLAGLSKLHDLNVYRAAFNDDAAAVIAQLPNLKELTANNTELGDKGFELLVNHPKIQQLYVDSTKVTKEVYRAAKQKFPDKAIYFYRYDNQE